MSGNQIKDKNLRQQIAVLTTNRLIQRRTGVADRRVVDAELEALRNFALNDKLNLSALVKQTAGLKKTSALGDECDPGFCPTPDGLCEPC